PRQDSRVDASFDACVWTDLFSVRRLARSGLGVRSFSVLPPPQPRDEAARIDPERGGAVTAFLDDKRWHADSPDHDAVLLEIGRGEYPGTGRVSLRGVETERHDEEVGREILDAPQRFPERAAVAFSGDFLRQRDVHVEAGTHTG